MVSSSPTPIEEDNAALIELVQGQLEELKEKRAIIQEVKEVNDQGIKMMSRMPATGGSKMPHMAEHLQRLTQGFGGAAGLARMVVAEWYASDPGSRQRTQLLTILHRFIAKCSEEGVVKRDLEHMSTSDLEREFERRVKDMLPALEGHVVKTEESQVDVGAGI